MGLINPTLPTIGQPNSTEDVDLLNCLTAILAEFNGHVGPANLEAGAALANLGSSIAEANLASGATGLAKGCFSAIRATSGQACGSSADTPVVFNSEEWDVSGWFNPANGRFTPQVAGYYRLNSGLLVSPGANVSAQFGKNGVVGRDMVVDKGGFTIAGSQLVVANGSTDYFYVNCRTSGTATTISSSSGLSYFQGELVGRS